MKTYSSYPAIYELVKQVKSGQVASYGMIASLLTKVTPRIVGYAMANVPDGQNIPWHRIINSAGKVSDRDGAERQVSRLKAEGVELSKAGRVTWGDVVWSGPDDEWLSANNIDMLEYLEISSRWPK